MTAPNNATPARPLPAIAWNACAAAARSSGLEPALVRAVCWVESRGNPKALSPVGAQGLMQLMPATARGLGVHDSWDPVQNAAGGARYLADLLVRFGSIEHMLAAYNWGPGNIDRVKAGTLHVPSSVLAYVSMVQARWEVEKTFSGPLADPPPPPAAAVVHRLRGSARRSSGGSSSSGNGEA